MKKQVIIIIKTYDNEVFEIQKSIKEWLFEKERRLKNGIKTLFLENYSYELYFSNVKSVKQKTKYLSLPEPKKEKPLALMGSAEKKELQEKNPEKFLKLQQEEKENRKKVQKIVKEHLENSKKRRAKRFMEERDLIIKNFAKREKEFGPELTSRKIEEWNKFKQKEILLNKGNKGKGLKT